MGFAASAGRALMLTARKHDITAQIQLINENMLQIGQAAGLLPALMSNLMPGSPESEAMMVRYQQLNRMEETLSKKLELAKMQYAAAVNELEAVQKVINEAVKSFKTFAN